MTFPKMNRGHSPDLQSRGYVLHLLGIKYLLCFLKIRAGMLKQSMGARHRVGIGLSYRPVRQHKLMEFILWNRFLGSINI
jgi:hypothetical protein